MLPETLILSGLHSCPLIVTQIKVDLSEVFSILLESGLPITMEELKYVLKQISVVKQILLICLIFIEWPQESYHQEKNPRQSCLSQAQHTRRSNLL